MLFALHGFQGLEIGAEQSGNGSEVRGAPVALDIGFTGCNSAAGQDLPVDAAVVNRYLRLRLAGHASATQAKHLAAVANGEAADADIGQHPQQQLARQVVAGPEAGSLGQNPDAANTHITHIMLQRVWYGGAHAGARP